MQLPDSMLLPVLVLLPILGGLCLGGSGDRQRNRRLALGVVGLQLILCSRLCLILVQTAKEGFDLSWQMDFANPSAIRLPFLQFALRMDLWGGLIAFLLAAIQLTCLMHSEPAVENDDRGTFFLWGGSTLFVLANDVCSVLTSGTLLTLTMAILAARTRSSWIALKYGICGWLPIFAALAWLMGAAALVPAAPRGLPVHTSSQFSELITQIQQAAEQHPAAEYLWQQYQLLPSLALLLGVCLLGGVVPFHRLFVQLFENGSFAVRIWTLSLAKIGWFLVARLVIAPAPAEWGSVANVFEIPALLSLIYVSLLVYANADPGSRLCRLALWSQQLTFVGLIAIPQQAPLMLSLSCGTHLSALVLLTLQESLVKHETPRRQSLLTIIAFACLAIAPGTTSLLLLWESALHLATAETFGAIRLLLFAIATLIALAGMLRFLKVEDAAAQRSPEEVGLDRWQKSLLVGWGALAILMSFAAPLLLA